MIQRFKRLPMAAQLFLVCFIQSGIVTVNFRAVAQARYLEAFCSDLALFIFGYYIVKKIGESSRAVDAFFYGLGGALGAQLCIWLTKLYFGA